ncbi:hypothetical protein R3P38DRAFT_1850965 [Favolaschia claudopus]|uniref:Uncharacterized protein n=1 Tax=Favolaschia claudopus TaxID=2862362 RepID=A0AAW0D9L2_9AGAR
MDQVPSSADYHHNRPNYSSTTASSSDVDSFFFHPPKSSSPIKIPGRDSNNNYNNNNGFQSVADERTTSPELIFEMEPFSPLDFSSTSHVPGLTSRRRDYSDGPSTSPRNNERYLLYAFPVLHRSNNAVDTNDAGSTTPKMPVATAVPLSALALSLPLPPISHNWASAKSASHRRHHSTSPTTATDPTQAIRAVPVHKITGFEPEGCSKDEGGGGGTPPAARSRPLLSPPSPSSTIRNFSSNASSSRPLSPLSLGITDSQPPPISTAQRQRPARRPGWHRSDSSFYDRESRGDAATEGTSEFTQYLFRQIESKKPMQHVPAALSIQSQAATVFHQYSHSHSRESHAMSGLGLGGMVPVR